MKSDRRVSLLDSMYLYSCTVNLSGPCRRADCHLVFGAEEGRGWAGGMWTWTWTLREHGQGHDPRSRMRLHRKSLWGFTGYRVLVR